MIWIDSSFAVEWLTGTERGRKVRLPEGPLGILPMQYTETFVYFIKKEAELIVLAGELEALELIHPEKNELRIGSFLYCQARLAKSKASLADAVLAAVARERRGAILSFDGDFKDLGFKEKNGLWSPT